MKRETIQDAALTFRQDFVRLGFTDTLDRAQRLLRCERDRFDRMQSSVGELLGV